MAAAKGAKNGHSDGRRYSAGTLALAVARSLNSKLGDAATTYAEQRSCPTSCVFYNGGGCYAEQGRLGWAVTQPLNRAAAEVDAIPEDIARAEAAAIDALTVKPGRPLRLHTLGDCKTDAAARIVAAAAARYVARGGGLAWTYTHAWREVERASWGDVHVFASCENAADIAAAEARGYATALVVVDYADHKLYQEDGVNVLPCPAQTKKGVTCSSCRLCMNSGRLREQRLTIGFAVHGTPFGQRRARLALTDPNDPNRQLSSRVLIPPFIESFTAEHGRPPKNAEIAKAIGISPASVSQMRRRQADEAAGGTARERRLQRPRRPHRPGKRHERRAASQGRDVPGKRSARAFPRPVPVSVTARTTRLSSTPTARGSGGITAGYTGRMGRQSSTPTAPDRGGCTADATGTTARPLTYRIACARGTRKASSTAKTGPALDLNTVAMKP